MTKNEELAQAVERRMTESTTITMGVTLAMEIMKALRAADRIQAERDRMAAAMMQIQRRDCPELDWVEVKLGYDARLTHAGVVEVAKMLLQSLAEADEKRRREV